MPQPAWRWNYLRIRGEELPHNPPGSPTRELPPHTRRRDFDLTLSAEVYGTTSAYAEKRVPFRLPARENGNYLRIRGEEVGVDYSLAVFVELPPHTRRRGHGISHFEIHQPTTSAYAEKRASLVEVSTEAWNYLRIRGEEFPSYHGVRDYTELPPHTRRREVHIQKIGAPKGTTSAYAEKSYRKTTKKYCSGNYLRIRGEERSQLNIRFAPMELPLHTRRRGLLASHIEDSIGTTSAYAEKRR